MTFSSGLTSTWNESSQGLVFLISIPVGLPPVGVILADDMEYISLLEGQAKLSTRHEGVIRRVVVKVRSYVHLRAGFYIVKDSCTHADRPSHAHTATYCKILTTVCLCGAGLIWELGMRRKVRVPCICCCGKHELQKIEHNRNMKRHYSFTCNLGDGFYILRAHLVQTTIICISFLNDSLKFNLPKQHFF